MYETIIIGAGIAGLSAAQYLYENGHDNFRILESFTNIGGRVQTINFNGKLFPTGPGWIHGRKNNPIFEIMNKLDIPMKQCQLLSDDNVFVWDSIESKNVTKEYLEKRKFLKEIIDNAITGLSENLIPSDMNLQDLLLENCTFFHNLTDIDRTVLFTCLEIYMGAPIKEVSALMEVQNDSIYDEEEGEINFRILDPLGGSKMIEFLSKDFRHQIDTKIDCNCTVKLIDWNNHNSHVTIKLDDGRELSCKNVIVTVQADLLAKGSIIFIPKLPKEKVLSWKFVPAVNYCKLFAKFPFKFWPDKDWLIPVIKDFDPVNELIFWQNAAHQNLCDEDDNILICHYTSGYSQKSCRFDVEDELLKELVTESMKNMFPDCYCKPSDVLFVSHWNNNRFSGSFTISAPGMDEELSKELPKNVGPLYFAGESVSLELMGTMQGAYVTGRNVAKDIIVKCDSEKIN